MNRKIIRLPPTVINQIAAGEVVENPASIVKELIENSLDAGAKSIAIQLVEGGFQLIRVEDDGCGMGSDDALLSVERHATSKLEKVDDLQRLLTMGFRGEALAAISSVSRFELQTSDGNGGTRLFVEGGHLSIVEPLARNQGTTIEVRSLFYNVPARKKFQKSATTSAAQVTKVVQTLALAHPEITFCLNGKTFSACSQKERIAEILGSYDHSVNGPNISGFVGSPGKAMVNRSGQYLYINKRPIFSPLVSKAVKQAFGTRIAEEAHPRFILFLELDLETVDVNVHPQKREVRFLDEGRVFRIVQEAVEKAFSPQISFSEPLSFTAHPPFSFAEISSQEPASLFYPENSLPLVFQEKPLAVFGSYLLLQKEGWILVDLKAAHARILYESLRKEKGDNQPLIWPLEIPLESEEEERALALLEAGLEGRILKKTLVVDALPFFLEAADFPQFFADWKEGKSLEHITARFCRSIRKTFSLDLATVYWKKVRECSDFLYDPLGNPILIELNQEDLGRIMRGKHG